MKKASFLVLLFVLQCLALTVPSPTPAQGTDSGKLPKMGPDAQSGTYFLYPSGGKASRPLPARSVAQPVVAPEDSSDKDTSSTTTRAAKSSTTTRAAKGPTTTNESTESESSTETDESTEPTESISPTPSVNNEHTNNNPNDIYGRSIYGFDGQSVDYNFIKKEDKKLQMPTGYEPKYDGEYTIDSSDFEVLKHQSFDIKTVAQENSGWDLLGACSFTDTGNSQRNIIIGIYKYKSSNVNTVFSNINDDKDKKKGYKYAVHTLKCLFKIYDITESKSKWNYYGIHENRIVINDYKNNSKNLDDIADFFSFNEDFINYIYGKTIYLHQNSGKNIINIVPVVDSDTWKQGFTDITPVEKKSGHLNMAWYENPNPNGLNVDGCNNVDMIKKYMNEHAVPMIQVCCKENKPHSIYGALSLLADTPKNRNGPTELESIINDQAKQKIFDLNSLPHSFYYSTNFDENSKFKSGSESLAGNVVYGNTLLVAEDPNCNLYIGTGYYKKIESEKPKSTQ